MEATEDTGFQAETLRGDVRDKFMDDVVRRMPGWTQMREHEQKGIISTVNSIACFVVRKVAEAVVHRGFTHMLVTTGEWKVKDGIKLQVGASGSVEDITKLAEHGGGSAILVFADVRDFFGQRADAAFDRDEPELPIDGEPAHDPETGEVLGDEANDEGEEALPSSDDLPEPPADDADSDEGEEPAAITPEPEPEARSSRRRRAPASVEA